MRVDNTWTPAQEEELRKLTEQRAEFYKKQKAALASVVERDYFREMFDHEVVDMLIKHADDITAALKPYCKGKP